MKIFLTLVWTLVIFGSLAGLLIIFITLKAENFTAFQEVSGFALAVACASVPYCLARAITEIFGEFTKK